MVLSFYLPLSINYSNTLPFTAAHTLFVYGPYTVYAWQLVLPLFSLVSYVQLLLSF